MLYLPRPRLPRITNTKSLCSSSLHNNVILTQTKTAQNYKYKHHCVHIQLCFAVANKSMMVLFYTGGEQFKSLL